MDFDKLIEKHKEDVTELSLLGFNLGVAEGSKSTKKRVLRMIERQICFENHISCDHSSCYTLSSLYRIISEDV